jgi:hypothetical protein
MKALRVLVPAVLTVALVPLGAAPAMAAPPANDDPGGAVVLNLGDRVEQDTSQATTDADDATINQTDCGAPATNASVWYQFTLDAKAKVALDTTESDYTAGLMVFEGTPTVDSFITCGPGIVGVNAQAGQTYYVMAFSDTAVNGGALVLSMKKAIKPRVHVTVAKHGVAFRGGAARIHGTYSCTHAESGADLFSHLFQRAGRLKIQAETDTGVRCNGKRHHWSARLVSQVGTYARGAARARVGIISCGVLQCTQHRVKRHVHLTWAKAHRGPVHPTARKVHPRALIDRQKHWGGR